LSDKTKKEELVDETYANSDDPSGEYSKILREAQEKGECPFCPENLNNIILEVSDGWPAHGWVAIENKWPYKNADVHLVLIPRRHITTFEGISPADWIGIQNLVKMAKEKYPTLDNYGGGLALRFGTNSGVTIRHLHFHLIAPVTNPDTGKVFPNHWVNFPFG
jgi:diadenosine tetraphosphate (Ap4A) HIT family hydrolase